MKDSVERFRMRSGSTAALTAANFVLAKGEPCFDTTEKSVKVGDGAHHWLDLEAYFLPTSDVEAAIAAETEARAAAVAGALANIAPDFDKTKTYAVGDFCIYNGGLYKCSTAIEEAGEWDAEKWTATTVMAEIAAPSTE